MDDDPAPGSGHTAGLHQTLDSASLNTETSPKNPLRLVPILGPNLRKSFRSPCRVPRVVAVGLPAVFSRGPRLIGCRLCVDSSCQPSLNRAIPSSPNRWTRSDTYAFSRASGWNRSIVADVQTDSWGRTPSAVARVSRRSNHRGTAGQWSVRRTGLLPAKQPSSERI